MPSKKIAPIASPNLPASSPLGISDSLALEKDTDVTYEDINVLKLLSRAKFPVYLAFSPSKNTNFAMKLFEFENNKAHPYFINEARFSFLTHSNIIKIVHVENKVEVASDKQDINASCLLMEYAPYGDLFDLIRSVRGNFDEKLARTYLRQLIDGIEYLHKNNVCHFDLKLENLLIGEDYQLKIADFDLSYIKGDSDPLTLGTKYYRAPELKAGKENVGPSADIYAAGIILFALKCGGVLPHLEDLSYNDINLHELLNNDYQKFFQKHCEFQEKEFSFFDVRFQELFLAMVKEDPQKRISIKNIKSSKWYKGSVYAPKDLKKRMKELLGH